MCQDNIDFGLNMLKGECGFVTVQTKYQIVITYLKLKRAGSFDVPRKIKCKGGRIETYDYHTLMEKILVLLSIPFHADEVTDDNGDVFIEFSYGIDHMRLINPFQNASLVRASGGNPVRIYGTLYGYPATAVEAMALGMCFKKDNLPVKIGESPIGEFFSFLPSKKHWQEELVLVLQQMRAALGLAPWLWEQAERSFQEKK